MKVLWIVNIVFPEVSSNANVKSGYGGGWMTAMADRLRERNDIELAVAIRGKVNEISKIKVNNIMFYVYPGYGNVTKNGGGNKGKKIWSYIVNDFKPNLIHAYGTEYAHYLELVRIEKNIPIVVSLQGILKEYYRHYYGGMDFIDIFRYNTISDFILKRGIYFGRRRFKYNIETENEILNTVKYVEGRTLWDKTSSLNINSELKYYHCPRLIRDDFYTTQKWEVSKVERHSIFIHQATYPIKGLHFVLDALNILKYKYPDIKLYISGNNLMNKDTIKKRLLTTGYSKYVLKKIKELKLEKYIHFTGILDSEKIVKKLLNTHVMVIPSAIENSPNSLAEAMLLGTPSIASFVGGTPEMLKDKEEGLLYCFNEPGMLATYISRIFESDELALKFSKNARLMAMKRHNPETLEETLIEIYKGIVNKY